MEKIAIIMNPGSRAMVMNERSIKRLEQIGEVVINQGSTAPEDVKQVISDATIAITSWGNGEFSEDILDTCPNLKIIAHGAGSVKPIVSDAIWERGIRVVSSANIMSGGVSDTALGFTIAASKHFFTLNDNIHAGGWDEGRENVKELFELTVGVVGAGWAGRRYIELLKSFDVDIILYDPYITEEKGRSLGAKKANFDTLLTESDIISIHAPSIPETHHMFNRDTLAKMKKDAVLINTARGSLIDEVALYEHMKAGNLKYACLDVFEPEPPSKDNPLRTLPNCIMTPHLAGQANNGLKKIGKHVCEEIERILAGEQPICEITQEMLATMA